MNQKGQALIEFVLIIPIVIILGLVLFDIGNIFYQKIKLENHYANAINLEEKQAYFQENNINFSQTEEEIVLSKEINILTPGFKNLLDDPYTIETRGPIYE